LYNRLTGTQIGGFGASGVSTHYTYDLAGNVTTKRVGGDFVASYAYDSRGRLISTLDAMFNTETFTYDRNGMLVSRTDRNRTTFEYVHDAMGRVISVSVYPYGFGRAYIRRYWYNFNGTVSTISLFSSMLSAVSFSYDAQGRIIRQEDVGLGQHIVHTFLYNAANNVGHFSTSINGNIHVWDFIEYDRAQRPLHVRTHGGHLATYEYDANSKRTRVTYSNGIITEFTFSPGNLITSVVNRRGNTVLSRFDYIHLMDGNVYQVTEQFQESGRNRTVVYTYDMARRLIREETTGHGFGARAFTFDTHGNRATMTVTGQENYTVTYSYDPGNRLITETRTGSNPHTRTFTYDNNGNQKTSTSGGQTETRIYNVFNQLRSVTRPGMTVHYGYDVNGLRRYRQVNGWQVYQVYNRGQLLAEFTRNPFDPFDEGQIINRFYVSIPSAHLINSLHHGFYLSNGRGDVVQRTDRYGNLTHTYQYDAFGNEIFHLHEYEPYSNNPFRFGGEYWDWERGEYYLRARSYNPRLGRFTQPDPWWGVHNMIFGDRPIIINEREDTPIELHLDIRTSHALHAPTKVPDIWAIMQASNLYVYCVNNPIMWVDGNGLFITKAIAAAIAAAATAVYKLVVRPTSSSRSTPPASPAPQTATRARAVIHGASWGNRSSLVTTASRPGQGGVTPVGRAFQKHNSRAGSAFTGTSSGNAAHNTQQGMTHLARILDNPNSTFIVRNTNAYGRVLDVRMPCGMGARWSADGTRFIGFLEP